MRIVAIVEGHGEVSAVPVLLRRIGAAATPEIFVDVPKPIRIRRSKLIMEGELERALDLAAYQCSETDGILVVIDADEDCPAELGPRLAARARESRPDRRIAVVLAKHEYEAWLVAAAESLSGCRGLHDDLVSPGDPEALSDPKGWLRRHCSPQHRYRPTLDQAALTQTCNLEHARRAPSFDKLWREVTGLIGVGA